ncbi:MAG TPA: hypothetical protein VFX92_09875 [Candidatus Krumholzibacteria bacterium]|nr:hypothetical protein [Candidatus Krumholzibacteria bacterium]
MRFRMLIPLAALALVASCGDEDRATNPPPPQDQSTIDDTPRENREAEVAALWMAGELFAPGKLYEELRDDLSAIRDEYLDSIPETAIQFFPPWVVTQLIILPDNATWDKIRGGEPNPVDSLNVIFHATGLDTLRFSWLWGLISYEGRLHPQRLAEIYAAQPGVIVAEPNGYGGDWDNMYPWKHDGHMTYLFRSGYGDCPAGCIFSDFWYFRRVDGHTEYVGAYSTENDPMAPDWWDEAKTAYDRFWEGGASLPREAEAFRRDVRTDARDSSPAPQSGAR